MGYDKGAYRSFSTAFTTRRGFYFNRSGWTFITFALLTVLFSDREDKYNYVVPALVSGICFLWLGRRFRHAKPRKGVEYDENGNVKPQRR